MNAEEGEVFDVLYRHLVPVERDDVLKALVKLTETKVELATEKLNSVVADRTREAVAALQRAEAAELRGDLFQKEVDRWTQWRSEQPWLAEIDGYRHQLSASQEREKRLRDTLRVLRTSPNICGYMSGVSFKDEAAVLRFIDDALKATSTHPNPPPGPPRRSLRKWLADILWN